MTLGDSMAGWPRMPDIVGEKHLAAAARCFLPSLVSTSSVPESRQEAGRLEAGCQSWYKPSGISVTVVLWAGNVAERRAVSPQAYTSRQGWRKNRKRGVAVPAWLCLLHAGDDRCVRGAQRCRVRGGIDCHAD